MYVCWIEAYKETLDVCVLDWRISSRGDKKGAQKCTWSAGRIFYEWQEERGWQTEFYINLPVSHLSLESDLWKISSIDAGFPGELKDIISLFFNFCP